MMIIEKIDSYKDGGTISMQVQLNFYPFKYKGEICLDRRIGIDNGKFWYGYPEKPGSKIIDNPEILERIKKGLEDHKKYQNYKLDEMINSL